MVMIAICSTRLEVYKESLHKSTEELQHPMCPLCQHRWRRTWCTSCYAHLLIILIIPNPMPRKAFVQALYPFARFFPWLHSIFKWTPKFPRTKYIRLGHMPQPTWTYPVTRRGFQIRNGSLLDLSNGQFSERCDVDGSFFNSNAIPIIFGKA